MSTRSSAIVVEVEVVLHYCLRKRFVLPYGLYRYWLGMTVDVVRVVGEPDDGRRLSDRSSTSLLDRE
jgi:hypothetical protein